MFLKGPLHVPHWALNLSSSWVTLPEPPDPLIASQRYQNQPLPCPAPVSYQTGVWMHQVLVPLRAKQFCRIRALVLPSVIPSAGLNRPPVIGYHTTEPTGASSPSCPCYKNNSLRAGQHFFIGNLKLPDPERTKSGNTTLPEIAI
jgi:hypothetical protein